MNTLETMLKEVLPGLRIETLTGKTNKKQREQIRSQAQKREIDIFLATQLAREGLNLPYLNRLFLCTPKRAAGAVQQEVGRITR